jgi:MFS family permease
MSAIQDSPLPVAARTTSLSEKSQTVAVICGCIVAFAYSANYTNHAPLAPALMREFGFNNAMAGFLTTGIFLTHAGMQIPGGYLVDRFGSRRMLLIALLWVAAGNFLMAAAGAYWQLLFCKIFTGVGTGICFVGGARYIHEGCAGPRLNVAQGFFGGSIQLGAGFVIFAVPQIYKLAGWRATFLVCAGMVLIAAVIWIAKSPRVEFPPSAPGKFHQMILAPQLWLLGLFQMATFGISVVVGSWVVAPGDCLAAARRMAPPSHGDSSVVCRESPHGLSGMLLIFAFVNFAGDRSDCGDTRWHRNRVALCRYVLARG